MKALFISHFYPPEPAAAATRVASFVDALANAGHEVTVVTNYPSFPRGRFSERRLPLMRCEKTGRTRTVRLFSLLVPGMPGSRLLHWLSAALSASLVHKLMLFYAPKFAGESGVPFARAHASVSGHTPLSNVRVQQFGPDVAIEAYLQDVYN